MNLGLFIVFSFNLSQEILGIEQQLFKIAPS